MCAWQVGGAYDDHVSTVNNEGAKNLGIAVNPEKLTIILYIHSDTIHVQYNSIPINRSKVRYVTTYWKTKN